MCDGALWNRHDGSSRVIVLSPKCTSRGDTAHLLFLYDLLTVLKLASNLHVRSVNYAAKLVHTRRALSSTIINSHQETVSGQACKPPDLHSYYFFPLVEELYGTRYQSGSFSIINVGSGFHCLRRLSFSLTQSLPGNKKCWNLNWVTLLFPCMGTPTFLARKWHKVSPWLTPWRLSPHTAHPFTSQTVPISQFWLYLPFPVTILQGWVIRRILIIRRMVLNAYFTFYRIEKNWAVLYDCKICRFLAFLGNFRTNNSLSVNFQCDYIIHNLLEKNRERFGWFWGESGPFWVKNRHSQIA